MGKDRKFIAVVFVLFLLFNGVFFLVASTRAEEKVTVLRLGHVVPPTHAIHKGCLKLSELVAARTDNKVQIQVFPSAQLGAERDLPVSTQMGTIEMSYIAPASVGMFEKSLQVIDAPYLFKDDNHWKAVLRREIGKEMSEKLLKRGIRILDFMYRGKRHIMAKRPIYRPDDFKGMKFRVPDIPLYTTTFRHLGATPTPIAFAEVYLALSQGIVEGLECPIDLLLSMKFHEVAKYVTLIGWNNAPGPLLINEQAFQSLSPKHQKILLDSAREATDYQYELQVKDEEKTIEIMKGYGVTIIVPPNIEEWRQRTKQAVVELVPLWGDPELYDRIYNYKY